MKKSVILLPILLVSQFAFGWTPEEDQAIEQMVKNGQPKLTLAASECATDKDGKDLLGYKRFSYSSRPGLCVNAQKLPKKVLHELWDMEDEQLENESDYDSRLTKVYVMTHDGILSYKGGFHLSQLDQLREAFNIPKTDNVNIEAMEPKVNSTFDMLRYGFTIGGHYYPMRDTYVGQYLKSQLDKQVGLHIEFREELILYPGGGLNVTYHVFMMDEKLVYVKAVWWNS